MREEKAAIEQHLHLIETLHGRGAYRDSYECAKAALVEQATACADPLARARLRILAAKSAYYVGEFDESLALLDASGAALPSAEGPASRALALEAALVRANVLRRRGRFADAIAALDAAGADAALEVAPDLLVERLLIEGACRFYLNDTPRAEERLEAALGLAIHHGDQRLKSRVLTMLGLVAQLKGAHGTALEYFERAAEICRARADYYGEAAAALNAAILLYRRGLLARSGEGAERARAIFESLGWEIGVCRAHLVLGNVAKQRGEPMEALRQYRRAKRIAAARGFARERALALEFAGDVLAQRGHVLCAERLYGEGLRIAESIAPEGDVVVEINRRIGELLVATRNIDAALPFLRRALRFAQRLGDRLEEGAVLRSLGAASYLIGAPDRGRNLFNRAIGILHDAGCEFELARTYLAHAQALVGDGAGSRAGAPGVTASSEAVDGAWSCAVEAAHLFGRMEAGSGQTAAVRLVDRLAAIRCRRIVEAPALARSSRIVEIRASREMLLHEGFVAISAAMIDLWNQVRFAASYDRPVLVTGDTGTGKELVARVVHDLGARARRPFIAVNCAAVPDHLFESEFFGHRRGCFTGALTDRIGLIEAAHGGTLFLDEVGELTPLQQVKLLRVLQEEKIRRVGENVERPVSVRIVSATNRNLEERLASDAMRMDFYYRINAERIHVPPLRDRSEDIVPLLAYKLCMDGCGKRPAVRIELAALRGLQRYAWPGNVRELFSVVERISHMANGGTITADMLPEGIKTASGIIERPEPPAANPSAAAGERLRRALEACGGNKTAAARWLGISRGTLYKELRRCGIADMATPPGA